MITAFFETLHTKIASLWGNLCAWGGAGYAWMYGGMEPITALGATLAAALTLITIIDRMRRREDVEMLRQAFRHAEQTSNDELREMAAHALETTTERKRHRATRR